MFKWTVFRSRHERADMSGGAKSAVYNLIVCMSGHEGSGMSDGGKLQCSSGQCSGLDMRGWT